MWRINKGECWELRPLAARLPSDTHLVGYSSFLLMQTAWPLQYHWLS